MRKRRNLGRKKAITMKLKESTLIMMLKIILAKKIVKFRYSPE